MTKAIPTIQKFMTTTPKTVNSNEKLSVVKKLMASSGFRHLPVLSDEKIVGIISESDLALMQSFKGVDLEKETVKTCMTPAPKSVQASTPLDVVCKEMAANKIGSILVEDNHKLVGIFTWVDALYAMDELLHSRLK